MIEEHPAPLTYDLRVRFGLSLRDLGDVVPWDESVWLVEELLTDPSSHLVVAVNGWDHPVSREWVVLAQLVDAVGVAWLKGTKPWPRPWPDEQPAPKQDVAVQRSPEEVQRILDDMRTGQYDPANYTQPEGGDRGR